MLNILWPIFIIIAFIFSAITGKISELNTAIFDSAKDAVQMTITFFGTICMWNGIMKILQETSIMNKMTKVVSPIMKFLFPEIKSNDKEYKEITINVIANMLGLGNAATPLGLKAMKSMQEKNDKKDTLSNNMAMFIVLNTASLQIIPTTVIAIRTSLNSVQPTDVIVPIWCATIAADITGILVTKFFIKRCKK